ncbi:MAG: hypothetical protein KDA41_07165, partial [Planctomycetales bacterium]|nr:hypothetical protein [Planctomycetales bacterium]
PGLEAIRTQHGEGVYEDVATALLLFDWTIRNVQLDATDWNVSMQPIDQVIARLQAGEPADKVQPPAAPAGANCHAWEALLLGHGDAATRARVFLSLCRQRDIPVVMLGVPSDTGDDEPRPWAAAALIGDELFLFDAELGLPIPGPDGAAVATLKQVLAQPELLRRLDLDEEHPYWMAADKLTQLIGLIDATPAQLSQRMWLVERQLRALPAEEREDDTYVDRKLVLTSAPGKTAKRLRELSVLKSQIWTVPYRALTYSEVRQAVDPQRFAARISELTVYFGPLPLFPARMHHFRGELESNDDRKGAKHYYLECRKPERDIAAVANVPDVTGELTPERRDSMQEFARAAKVEATYWLGLIAAGQHDYGSAIDYLEAR